MPDPFTIVALTYLTKGITKPVAEELGNLVADPVKSWRANNLIKILEKADGKLSLNEKGHITINPKILIKIADIGSLESEPELQEMWAGLIASSSTGDEGILYVDILSGLSKGQAKILQMACEDAEVLTSKTTGLLYSKQYIYYKTKSIQRLYSTNDIHILDQALDDLRRKGLIEGGFDIANKDNTEFSLVPTPLGLHFFARVSGYSNSLEFFNTSSDDEINNNATLEVTKDTTDNA